MENKNKKETWAPVSSVFTGGKGQGGPGQVSFEAYFLRDLYKHGKIDDKLLRDIAAQNQLNVNMDEVIAVLKDTEGKNIPRGLAAIIADLAAIVPAQN